MVEHGCRRLPVLDAAGAVVGVIALDDLLQAYTRLIDALAKVVGTAGAWDAIEA
jgi:CBS domain-containing protein